jgi:hypothetical protein
MRCGSEVEIVLVHGRRKGADQRKFIPSGSDPELLLKLDHFSYFFFFLPIPVYNTQEIFQLQKVNKLNKVVPYIPFTESAIK